MFTALKMFEIVKIVPMIDTGLESRGLAAGWTLDTGHAATTHILLAEDYKYLSAAIDVQFRQEQQIGLFLSFLIPKASQKCSAFCLICS